MTPPVWPRTPAEIRCFNALALWFRGAAYRPAILAPLLRTPNPAQEATTP